MTKSMQLENKLNTIGAFSTCVIFTRGHKFFIQELVTGEIIKSFFNAYELEIFIECELEEKRRKEMFENIDLEDVNL